MKRFITIQLDPDTDAQDYLLQRDLGVAVSYLGNIEDDSGKVLSPLRRIANCEPVDFKGYQNAALVLVRGISHLSRFDGLEPKGDLEQVILQSCHEQRDLVRSILSRITDIIKLYFVP